MKKVIIKLTQRQVDKLNEARYGMNGFGLIAQPLVYAKEMRVLVLSTHEFKKANTFFKKFVPKKLRTK